MKKKTKTQKETEKKQKQLLEKQLIYYDLAIERTQLQLQERKSRLDLEVNQTLDDLKRTKDIKKVWRKFHKLNGEKIFTDICKIIKENWEYWDVRREVFDSIYVREYFLNKGIDLSLIFSYSGLLERQRLSSEGVGETYFEEYGIEEKIRWEKVKIKLTQFIEEHEKEQTKRELEEKIQRFVDKAIDEGLQDVTAAHIKRMATEIGEDISRMQSLLTNAVSVRLRAHWGENTPRRKRELTKSIKIEVFKRDDYKCIECGKGKESKLHVHHIVPHSGGGTDEMSNLVTLCESCNLSIGNRRYKPPTDWIGYQIYKKK